VKFLLLPSLLVAGLLPPNAATAAPIEKRTINLIVYGNDPCPKGVGDEIVVCARRPEGERYRIPKSLRDKPKTDAPSTSWASRWQGLEEQSRFTRPDSCSPVGTGGQTGCTQAMLHQWWLERRAAAADGVP
jgi:hypothetical protein